MKHIYRRLRYIYSGRPIIHNRLWENLDLTCAGVVEEPTIYINRFLQEVRLSETIIYERI